MPEKEKLLAQQKAQKQVLEIENKEIVSRPNPAQSVPKTSNELLVTNLVSPSSCSVQAKAGDMLTVHYAGYFSNTLKFDSRYFIYFIKFIFKCLKYLTDS